MKKFMLFLLILIICIVGIIYYYLAPLSSDKFLRHGDLIDKILIYYYMENDERTIYNLSVEDLVDINEIIRIFDSFVYTRSANQSGFYANKILRMAVIYKEDKKEIHFCDIYSGGYVVFGKFAKNKKTFKVKNNAAEVLIDRLVQWVNEKDNR